MTGAVIEMRSFAKKLHSLRRCQSGNTVLMVALGLPALLGATGYGVDTAQWYMWQRELQHSVDQAAIGGAWTLAYDNASTQYVTRAEQEYYANQDLTASFDSAPTVARASYNGGSNNSVLVTASVTRTLPFTGLLLNRSSTIAARAQAIYKAGVHYNACLITLKEDGTTFEIGGNANVIANCGLGALSCGEEAIVIDGSATVETTSIAACGGVTVPEANQDAVSENLGEGVLSDAYADIPVPKPDASTPSRTYVCTGRGSRRSANLLPGKYAGGITVSCATTFSPGIYYIDGGVFDLTTNDPVVGTGVLFVLRNGAQLKLGGEGGSGSVNLTPISAITLQGTPYEADADKLSQMLFIEDKTGVSQPVEHRINGNTNLIIQGVVYLPNGNVSINGDSGTNTDLCFQISAYTLKILGSAYLRTLCDYDASTQLGASAPGVRLVA